LKGNQEKKRIESQLKMPLLNIKESAIPADDSDDDDESLTREAAT
jgi:hypothetical protein